MQNEHIEIPSPISGYEIYFGAFSVVFPESTVNLVTNPSLEFYTTGWTATGAGTIVRSLTYQRRGNFAGLVTPAAGASNGAYYTTASLGASWHTASIDVRGEPSCVYQLYVADAAATRLSAITRFTGRGKWQRVSVSYLDTAAAARRIYIMRLSPTASVLPFYVDGLQFENKAYATTYCDGDQVGLISGRTDFFWDGAPHASTSRRIQDSRAGGREILFSDLHFEIKGVMGLGHPPIENISRDLNTGGALFQNTVVRPREFSLAGIIEATDMGQLMEYRANLINSLTPFVTAERQPLKIGYRPYGAGLQEVGKITACTNLDEPVWFVCSYVAGLDGTITNDNSEELTISFTEYLPGSFEDGEVAMELATANILVPDYCSRRDNLTGLWDTIGTAANGPVYDALELPDGRIVLVGNFTNICGIAANRCCFYEPSTKTATAIATGADGPIYSVAKDSLGNIFFGGLFPHFDGVDANNIASYNLLLNACGYYANGANIGTDDVIYNVCLTPDDTMYVFGDFLNATAVACNRCARWDSVASTFVVMGAGIAGGGANGDVLDSAMVGNNSIWISGYFTSVNNVLTKQVAQWNHSTYAWVLLPDTSIAVGTGTCVGNSIVYDSRSGYLFLAWTDVGGTLGTHIYKRNSSYWENYYTGVPGTFDLQTLALGQTGVVVRGDLNTHMGEVQPSTELYDYGIWQRCANTRNAQCLLYTKRFTYFGHNLIDIHNTSMVTVQNTLPIASKKYSLYPTFRVGGPGDLTLIYNQDQGGKFCFRIGDRLHTYGPAYTPIIHDGETWVMKYTPYGYTFTSSIGANVAARVIQPTNMSKPIASPLEPNVNTFMYPNWAIYNDNNSQITELLLTGYNFSNTTDWHLYPSVIDDAAGFFHINFYKDAARTVLVAHTASLNATVSTAIIPDGASGMGGVVAFHPVAADVDIYINMGYILARWTPVYSGIDLR